MRLAPVLVGIAFGVAVGLVAWESARDTGEAPRGGGGAAARLDAHRELAAPVVAGNLTVWPVLADASQDVGEFLTLAEAQARGVASVRELGATEHTERARQGREQAAAQCAAAAAEVNRLVIDNRGDLPILVCAGTLLLGGNQDRQLGEDVVVAPRTALPVEVYCVEPGRWTSRREGVETDACFKSVAAVATKAVRVSAQYAKSQEAVWSRVGEECSLSGAIDRSSAAGRTTFLQMIENATERTRTRREEVATSVRAHFDGLAAAGVPVVGYAYAVNGKPAGVRAFAHPKLFRGQFEPFLMAMVLEAEGSAGASGAPARAEDVVAMVRGIDAGEALPDVERVSHKLRSRRSAAGFNSACFATLGAAAIAVTEDWTAK